MTEKVELENDGQGNMKVDKIITTLFESKQRVELKRAGVESSLVVDVKIAFFCNLRTRIHFLYFYCCYLISLSFMCCLV